MQLKNFGLVRQTNVLQFGSLSMNMVTVKAYEQYGVSVTFIYWFSNFKCKV